MTHIENELFNLLQEIRETATKESVSQYLMSQIERACGLIEVIKNKESEETELMSVFPW